MKKFVNQLFSYMVVLFFILMLSGKAHSCTGITVKTEDGSVISSRTLEFAAPLNSQVVFIPRGHETSLKFTSGKKGLSWKQKYSILGLNGFNMPIIIEGFNEKGLSVGAFFFPNYSKFEKLTDENSKQAVSSGVLPTWIVGNFATVAEVRKALTTITVVGEMPQGIDEVLPAHYRVTDATGDQIVIEYVDRGLRIYDNPTGVITNAPEFDWHLTNIQNYLNLSAINPKPYKINGKELKPFGFGAGMRGLPGDFSPPSRFIRAVALSLTVKTVKTAEEGVNLAWHIINNVDIPTGAACGTEADGSISMDKTEWVNVSDLKNLVLYFRSYDNHIIRKVDMKKLNTNGSKVMYIPIETKPDYPDVTGEAR